MMDLAEEIYEGMYGDFPRLAKESYLRKNIEWAIGHIGKAYADGELELPGWQTIFCSISCWQEKEDGTQILTTNAPDNGKYWLLRADGRGAIGLRPLSGTGKEEEK